MQRVLFFCCFALSPWTLTAWSCTPTLYRYNLYCLFLFLYSTMSTMLPRMALLLLFLLFVLLTALINFELCSAVAVVVGFKRCCSVHHYISAGHGQHKNNSKGNKIINVEILNPVMRRRGFTFLIALCSTRCNGEVLWLSERDCCCR